jgi:hypothetical protein
MHCREPCNPTRRRGIEQSSWNGRQEHRGGCANDRALHLHGARAPLILLTPIVASRSRVLEDAGPSIAGPTRIL